jgi:hypothetical protein
VVTGTLTAGDITDTQTWNDGNILHISEAASTPGFDIQFTLTGLEDIRRICSNVYYAGSATHQVEWQIYNATTAAWDTLQQVPDSLGYNYRFTNFPADNVSDYIDPNTNETIIRLYHVSAGNTAHDIYIDYISIMR